MAEDWLTEDYAKLVEVVRKIGERADENGALDVTKLKRRLIPADVQKLAPKLIEGGMNKKEAAEYLGISPSLLQYHLGKIQDLNQDLNKAIAEVEAIELDVPLPKVGYGTIVVDPPWDMEKIERRVRPNQTGFDYPTMTEEQIGKLAVHSLALDDCHLFCWTTQKYLPASLKIIENWWFKYVLLMTWHKPGGFQPHGLPQYNSEFVIYARKGAPKFRETQAFNTCFQADRREHSRKPDAFYDTVRRVTGDGRLDMFSREEREGFDSWGNETKKFNAA